MINWLFQEGGEGHNVCIVKARKKCPTLKTPEEKSSVTSKCPTLSTRNQCKCQRQRHPTKRETEM